MKRNTFKKRRILWKRVFLYLIIIFLIAGGLFVYLRTGFFTIHNYEIVGLPVLPAQTGQGGEKDEYKQVLQEKFFEFDKRKLYKILPANRVISYHNADIKLFIREILPNTALISIYPTTLHTLKIVVKPYTPLFRLDDINAITKEGIVYKEIQDIGTLPLLIFDMASSITPAVLISISNIIPKISTTLFDVNYIMIDEYDDIYLKNEIDSKSAIMFSATAEISKVWSNIVSDIDTEPLKSKLKNNKSNLEYLDTRFGNKVFYRFTPVDNKKEIEIIFVSSTTPQQ